jgi:sporulation protein YtfJ
MADANTVVGQPVTTPDGLTLIPVSKISLGFGSGGGDFKKSDPAKGAFAGGVGAGINLVPVAFIVVRGESVRMLPVAPPAATTVDRLIEMAPDVIDRVEEFVRNRQKDKEDGE